MYCHKALFAKLVLAAWLSCSLGAIAAIPVATGSGVGALPTPQPPFFDITTFGAVSGGPAVANQTAINNAINAASAAGGGTVVVPAGDFKTFSIRLKSNVGLQPGDEEFDSPRCGEWDRGQSGRWLL